MKMTSEQLDLATQVFWEMSNGHTGNPSVKWDDLARHVQILLRANLVKTLHLMFPEEDIEIQ